MKKTVLGVLSLIIIFLFAFERVENDFKLIESHNTSEMVTVDFDNVDNFDSLMNEVDALSFETNLQFKISKISLSKALIYNKFIFRYTLQKTKFNIYYTLKLIDSVQFNQHNYPMLC